MKISSKLILAALVPLVVALAVGLTLIISYQELETAQEKGDKVRLIRDSINEINHLVFSYSNHPEERPKQQFLAEFRKMTDLLAGVRLRNPGQQRLLEEIRFNTRSMKDDFLRLVANTEQSERSGSNQLLRETEELLEGQLQIRSRQADYIASALRNQVDKDIQQSQRREITLILLVMGLTTVPLIVILIRMRKRIITAMTKLRHGTEIVSSGNLDHVITVERKDEIGDLTRAFNRMTSDLKRVTASKADLKQEMAEREKAEKELRTSRKFLEIANRHMDLDSLLQNFVGEMKEFTGCEAVGIRLLDQEGNIPYMAYQGFSRKFYESESPLSIKTDRCMCINVVKGTTDAGLSFYTGGGSFYMNGTTRFLATVSEEDKGQTRNVCNQTGYESVALIPIRLGTHILGLIHLADRQEDRVPLDTVRVLEQAATALGIGIQRTLAEESLKKAHNELEIKVAGRTEELMIEIEQRKRTEDALRESEEELRYLSSQILVAQEKERREIAEDLHDNTWQILNTIKIDIDQLLTQKMVEDPAVARQTGKRIIANIREAIERIRTMQGDLWPPVMDDIGLLATIIWYGREFEKSHTGITIEKQIGVSEEEVPQEIKIVIYRVMQEALKNAATHSRVSRIMLALEKDGPRVKLEITDNGQGFDMEQILFRARPWGGFGLMGMKERIEHSGGTFDLRSEEGRGTTVRAIWSLNMADQEIPDRPPAIPVFDIQEEPFRKVTEAISDWVYGFRIEPDGKVVWDWVTSGFTWVTGYSTDADLAEILYPEDKAVAVERFRHIKSLHPHVSEYRIVTKSGETCWVRDSVTPVADPLHPGTIRVVGAVQNITEHKQGEAERIRQNMVLEGINSIFREALIARSDEEVGRVCLAVAEEITQSKFGFVGEIGSDGLLHDIAISDPGWELCAMSEKTGHRGPPGDFKIHGLVGRVLKDGKSLLTNTPSKHPDSIGTPPGHPPLKAFIGVPLIREEQTIGMIAVGNREGGYTEKELESLEGLAPAIVHAFEHKRTEAEIHQRVAELTRFNRAAVDRGLRMIELKKQINELCGRLGQPPRYPLDLYKERV